MSEQDQSTAITQRVKSVFEYLKALHEKRNPTLKSISDTRWSMWLAKDIEESLQISKCLLRCTSTSGVANAIPEILKVKRPELTECDKPPASIADWIHAGWESFKCTEVKWSESTNRKAENELTVIERFEDSLERIADRDAWLEKRTRWQKNEAVARAAMVTYERLSELYGMFQRDSEKLELAVGDGILSFNSSSGRVLFPLLIKRVKLLFDPAIPQYSVVDSDMPAEFNSALLVAIPEFDRNLSVLQLPSNSKHPLDETADGELAKIATYLMDSGRFVGDQHPEHIDGQLVIYRSPVLFVRPRSLGIGRAIEDTLTNISERTQPFSDALGRIVGFQEESSDSRTGNDLAAPLFGKPANMEQEKIAELLERYNSVLVQGPPGTGKSHTIANLVGHLLAQGKRILITSQTTKALRVLRGLVANEIRPLCMSVLDEDAASRRELKESIEEITEKLANSYEEILEREATEFEGRLYKQRERRKALTTELMDARRAEHKPIVIDGTSLEAISAAKEVREGMGKNDWIPDEIALDEVFPLTTQEFCELYESNELTDKDDEELQLNDLPNSAKLFRLRQLQEIFERTGDSNVIEVHSRNKIYWPGVRFASNQVAFFDNLAARISLVCKEIKRLSQWELAAVEAGRVGVSTSAAWHLLLETIVAVDSISAENKLQFLQFGPMIDPSEPLVRQLETASEVLAHFSRGKRLSRFALALNSVWRARINSWKVNGDTPSTKEHFVAIEQRLRLEIKRLEMNRYWQELIGENGGPAATGSVPEQFYAQFIPRIRTLLAVWQNEVIPLIRELEGYGFDWPACLRNTEPLQKIHGAILREIDCLEQVVAPNLLNTKNWIEYKLSDTLLRECIKYLEQSKNTISIQLRDSLAQRDLKAYEGALASLRTLEGIRDALMRRHSLLHKLSTLPKLRRLIQDRTGVHGRPVPPGEIDLAWRYRKLDVELNRRSSENLDRLQRELDEAKSDIHKLTNRLIEKRSWARQVECSQSFRQDLVGWAQTVERIGAGYTLQAEALRREAREMMKNCVKAIPVWIMPLSRLADNFDFKTIAFDVVIVDEASQCDVMGLLALAIAKQVIVVGDHEQVTPSAVGQNLDSVTQLINTHLKDIPNSILYDGKLSLYHLAKSSFQSEVCLREHFRCTTNIIQFSNDLSYQRRIVPLRDDPKFVDDVIEHHLPNGKRRGDLNLPEADFIVSIILAMAESDEYNDATIGVISMVKDRQALHIEKLLMSHLPAEKFQAHRILCGNASQFQGDERDVIFLSLVDTPKAGPLPMSRSVQMQQRFNVAASRAKNQLWVVHSLDPTVDIQVGDLRRRLIEHARDPSILRREIENVTAQTESPFEKEVAKALVERGYKVVPQWKVGAFSIDLVVQFGIEKLAVECDGEKYHNADNLAADMNRQAILERLGWRFHRIRGYEFYRDSAAAINRLVARLKELGISPQGEHDLTAATAGELTERIRRRAAQIRQEWLRKTNGDSTEQEEAESEAANEWEAALPTAMELIENEKDDFYNEPTHTIVQEREPSQPTVSDEYWTTLELDERIKRLLESTPGLQFVEIAERLRVSIDDIQHTIFGRLTRFVAQDPINGRWRLRPGVTSSSVASPAFTVTPIRRI